MNTCSGMQSVMIYIHVRDKITLPPVGEYLFRSGNQQSKKHLVVVLKITDYLIHKKSSWIRKQYKGKNISYRKPVEAQHSLPHKTSHRDHKLPGLFQMCLIESDFVQKRHSSDCKQGGAFHTFNFQVLRHLSRSQEFLRSVRLLKPILNLGNLYTQYFWKARPTWWYG